MRGGALPWAWHPSRSRGPPEKMKRRQQLNSDRGLLLEYRSWRQCIHWTGKENQRFVWLNGNLNFQPLVSDSAAKFFLQAATPTSTDTARGLHKNSGSAKPTIPLRGTCELPSMAAGIGTENLTAIPNSLAPPCLPNQGLVFGIVVPAAESDFSPIPTIVKLRMGLRGGSAPPEDGDQDPQQAGETEENELEEMRMLLSKHEIIQEVDVENDFLIRYRRERQFERGLLLKYREWVKHMREIEGQNGAAWGQHCASGRQGEFVAPREIENSRRVILRPIKYSLPPERRALYISRRRDRATAVRAAVASGTLPMLCEEARSPEFEPGFINDQEMNEVQFVEHLLSNGTPRSWFDDRGIGSLIENGESLDKFFEEASKKGWEEPPQPPAIAGQRSVPHDRDIGVSSANDNDDSNNRTPLYTYGQPVIGDSRPPLINVPQTFVTPTRSNTTLPPQPQQGYIHDPLESVVSQDNRGTPQGAPVDSQNQRDNTHNSDQVDLQAAPNSTLTSNPAEETPDVNIPGKNAKRNQRRKERRKVMRDNEIGEGDAGQGNAETQEDPKRAHKEAQGDQRGSPLQEPTPPSRGASKNAKKNQRQKAHRKAKRANEIGEGDTRQGHAEKQGNAKEQAQEMQGDQEIPPLQQPTYSSQDAAESARSMLTPALPPVPLVASALTATLAPGLDNTDLDVNMIRMPNLDLILVNDNSVDLFFQRQREDGLFQKFLPCEAHWPHLHYSKLNTGESEYDQMEMSVDEFGDYLEFLAQNAEERWQFRGPDNCAVDADDLVCTGITRVNHGKLLQGADVILESLDRLEKAIAVGLDEKGVVEQGEEHGEQLTGKQGKIQVDEEIATIKEALSGLVKILVEEVGKDEEGSGMEEEGRDDMEGVDFDTNSMGVGYDSDMELVNVAFEKEKGVLSDQEIEEYRLSHWKEWNLYVEEYMKSSVSEEGVKVIGVQDGMGLVCKKERDNWCLDS